MLVETAPDAICVENWGAEDLLPRIREYFQREIFNILRFAAGILYSQWGLIPRPLGRLELATPTENGGRLVCIANLHSYIISLQSTQRVANRRFAEPRK
jgi:hypothetical protein